MDDPPTNPDGPAVVTKPTGLETEKWLATFVVVFAAIMLLVWLVVGWSIGFDAGEWSKWEGWLEWGRDLVFLSIIPYLSKQVAKGLQNFARGGHP